MNKRKIVALSLFLSNVLPLTSAEVTLISSLDEAEKMFHENAFSVISYYRGSDSDSVEIDSFLEETKVLLEKEIEEGQASQRSLHWYKIDIEKTPELSFNQSGISNQYVVAPSTSKALNFSKYYEEKDANVEFFAAVIKDLTGDWIYTVECDDIYNPDRWYYNEVVFFGDQEDLQSGGVAEFLNTISMHDRYSFNDQPVGFLFNFQPECRQKMNLDKDKKHILIYNGDTIEPFLMTFEEDEISMDILNFWISA